MSDMPGFSGCLAAHQVERSMALQRRWRISCELADRVTLLLEDVERELGRTPFVISGYRTRAQQDELRRRGRPAAPDDRSNHRTLPATAVDVDLGLAPTPAEIATFGRIAVFRGLRWGGGSPVRSDGIPTDWPHIDLGPRPIGSRSGP